MAQVTEQITIGRKDERRVLRQHSAIGSHAFEEAVEFSCLRALSVSTRVNLARFGIGLATDLLNLTVSC